MGQEDSVRIHFVLPPGKNETTCSEDLAFAFDQTSDAGLSPHWTQHDEALGLSPSKMDVFVMDPFEGKAFSMVSSSKATVVGPRCLLSCLQRKEPIPELPYPMFTAAMKGLIITSTGFEKEDKTRIQSLVERMSGIYSNVFHDGVTHLVAAVVRSSKYSVAVEREIPIMTQEWVTNVWSKSQTESVDAIDRQFARHSCPPLLGLNISVSQMSLKDKELLSRSIMSNGGNYSKSLDMHSTHVLILPAAEGEKYTYARKWKIPCLNPNWAFDSIDKGHCLEMEPYRVEFKGQCSTPSKEEAGKLSEVSLCNTIHPPSTLTTQVNDTIESLPNRVRWIQSLDPSRVAKAGLFLEGCRIYLHGFDDPLQLEHLKRVLGMSGAFIMNQLAPSVTHMIVKSFAKTKVLKDLNLSPHQVTVQWVVQSMRLGRPAPEGDYAPPKILLPTAATGGLTNNILNVSTQDDELLAAYSKKTSDLKSAPPNTEQGASVVNHNEEDEDYSQLTKFLRGKKLALVDLDPETEAELRDWIQEEGGEVVSDARGDEGSLDILVLPVGSSPAAHGCLKAKRVVNHLWLTECFDKGGFVELEYFFKSYPIDKNYQPLAGVVIGISGFASMERQFLCFLTKALGGISQETFVKREKGNAKSSTHLVSLSPQGNKYDAAIRWRLPVVSKDWLLACLAKMTWVSEKPFLIGDSGIYSADRPLHESLPDAGCNSSFAKGIRDVPMSTPAYISQATADRLEQASQAKVSPSIGPQLVNSQSQKRKRVPSANESEDMSRDSRPWHANRNVSFFPPHSSQSESMEENEEVRKPRGHKSQAALDTLQAKGVTLLERAGRSFDDLMEDKMNRRRNNSGGGGKRAKLIRQDDEEDDRICNKSHAFEGIIVYVSKKCLSQLDRIRKIIQGLGGSVLNSYDEENVTHVVYSSNRENDASKEFRQARSDGKSIVSPEWIFDSGREERLLDTSFYPHTFTSPPPPRPSKPRRSSSTQNDELKSRDLSQDIAKMNEIIRSGQESLASSSARKMKMTLSSTPGRSSLEDDLNKKNSSSDFDSQALGSQIQWVDPAESKERLKLAKKLGSSETAGNNMDFQSMEVPESLPILPPESSAQPQEDEPKYIFMISGYPEDVKKSFGSLLESLSKENISLSKISGYDPSATHVIAPKFPRSEKMLCAIASGKMFLHSSYLEDCLSRQEIILPPEAYEWGHPQNSFLSKLAGFEEQLAKASYKWRLRLRESPRQKGSFTGIVAIIHTTPKRREAFQRLIEFGGGSVLSLSPPYSDPRNATHVFAEPSKVPKSRIDYEGLASKGIAVLEPIFINEYLIQDPPPPVENYLIPEFKPLWEKQD